MPASSSLSALATVTALLVLGACGVDGDPVGPEGPPAVRPAPPRLECSIGGPARSFPGASPALTSNAVVVRDADGAALLHRLDEPSAPIPLPSAVLAITWRGGTWLYAAPGAVGEVDEAGETRWELGIDVRAVDAAMALDGDALWLVLRDDEDEVSVRRIDFRARTAGRATSVGRGRGRLLVAAGRAAFAAAGANVWTPEGGRVPPGPPIALLGDQVIYEQDSSTGLWLGDPPVRLTRADVTPAAPVTARLGERIVVAYRDDGDIFVQAADAVEGALGEPVLIARDASPAAIATARERFWVAWERADTVEVRAGECDGG